MNPNFFSTWLNRLNLSSRTFVIAIPYLWLLLLFMLPFLIVFKLSFAETRLAIPPYTEIVEYAQDGHLRITLFLRNYIFLTEDPLYWKAYTSSVKIATIATTIALLVAYPVAYAMAKAPERYRSTLVMLVILPFWTSFLIRVYAWIGILKNEGFLNHFLLWLGVIQQPLQILHTDVAVYIGMVYSYLPFMLLPLYANLEKMDVSLLEAAADLGCTPIQAFWKITVPLSMPGVIAGCLLMFIPAVGEFVIPSLLGGSGTLMIGKTLWTEFFNNRDWPLASAAAVVLLLILVVPIMWFQRIQPEAK
jgi:putrescine transport system permease protein